MFSSSMEAISIGSILDIVDQNSQRPPKCAERRVIAHRLKT